MVIPNSIIKQLLQCSPRGAMYATSDGLSVLRQQFPIRQYKELRHGNCPLSINTGLRGVALSSAAHTASIRQQTRNYMGGVTDPSIQDISTDRLLRTASVAPASHTNREADLWSIERRRGTASELIARPDAIIKLWTEMPLSAGINILMLITKSAVRPPHEWLRTAAAKILTNMKVSPATPETAQLLTTLLCIFTEGDMLEDLEAFGDILPDILGHILQLAYIPGRLAAMAILTLTLVRRLDPKTLNHLLTFCATDEADLSLQDLVTIKIALKLGEGGERQIVDQLRPIPNKFVNLVVAHPLVRDPYPSHDVTSNQMEKDISETLYTLEVPHEVEDIVVDPAYFAMHSIVKKILYLCETDSVFFDPLDPRTRRPWYTWRYRIARLEGWKLCPLVTQAAWESSTPKKKPELVKWALHTELYH
eukprot:GHVT01095448.1.p1 GENE.GHVT01095448.1~~GHVT01095448.1.p1  ORF type:complete len:421 (+),score=15.10 GHVT01095448.1:250-1512(+)